MEFRVRPQTQTSHLANSQWKESGEPEGLSTAPVLSTPPTISETTISLEEMQARTRFQMSFLKALKGKGLDALLALFRKCFDIQSSPVQWKLAQAVEIFKKGAADEPSNYRPISLLQTCYKLYARIIANRLSEGLDEHIRELQFGRAAAALRKLST